MLRRLYISSVLLIVFAAICLFTPACHKHKGYKRIKDAAVVKSGLLECLADNREADYVIRSESELHDTTLFHNVIDTNVVGDCWAQNIAPDLDFSQHTLIGVAYAFVLESTVDNGTASVKIYRNESGSEYIIDVSIHSADQGGFTSALGQIWFTIPKIDNNTNVTINKQLI